jgi:hypothetical protein
MQKELLQIWGTKSDDEVYVIVSNGKEKKYLDKEDIFWIRPYLDNHGTFYTLPSIIKDTFFFDMISEKSPKCNIGGLGIPSLGVIVAMYIYTSPCMYDLKMTLEDEVLDDILWDNINLSVKYEKAILNGMVIDDTSVLFDEYVALLSDADKSNLEICQRLQEALKD